MNLKYHRGRPPRILNSQRRPPRILFSNQIKPATFADHMQVVFVSIWFPAFSDLMHRIWESLEVIAGGQRSFPKVRWFLTNPNHTSPNLQIMPDYLETLIFGVVWFVLVQDGFVSNKNEFRNTIIDTLNINNYKSLSDGASETFKKYSPDIILEGQIAFYEDCMN